MLKYLNPEKTAAAFNNAQFNIAKPDDWASIGSAITREAVLDFIAAGNTPQPADIPTPPTPMQQIRALEQANDDSQRKLNRQAAIDTALTIASRNPAAAGMTRDQVHAAYYASNRGYKSMVDLETACAALRKLIV